MMIIVFKSWHSLNGQAHINGEAGLENFTIIIPDKLSIKELAIRIRSSTNAK
jgi:hypothetical protein